MRASVPMVLAPSSVSCLLALLALATMSGCFDPAVPAEAVLGCVDDSDCPSGLRCEELVQRCTPLGFNLPLAEPQQVTTGEDVAIDVVIAGDDSAEVVIASVAFVGDVSVIDAAARTVRYTPRADFVGIDRFAVALERDGFVGPPANVDVEVIGAADAPFARDSEVDCVEDTPCEVVLVGGDPDGDGVVFVVDTPPTFGALSADVSVSGALTYLANPDRNGDDRFGFRVEGSDGVASAELTVHVRPQNDPPTATATHIVGPRGGVIDLGVVDVDGDDVAIDVANIPAGFTFAFTADGLDVVPPVGFSGGADLTLALDDGSGTVLAPVRLDVHAPRSCAAWREWLGAAAASGEFEIDVDGPGPAPAHLTHCDQTTQGGGWTLVAAMDGRTQAWAFASPLWLDDSTLAPAGALLEGDSKLPGFNSLVAEELLIVSADFAGAVRGAVRVPLPRDVSSARALFADRGFVALPDITIFTFRPLVDVDQLEFPPGGTLVGINVLGNELDAAARLGFTDDDFDVSMGLGLRRFSGEPTAGNNNQAIQALLYVRSADHSLARPQRDCLAHAAAGAVDDGLYSGVDGGLLRCDLVHGGFTRVLTFDGEFDGACPPGLADESLGGERLSCGRGFGGASVLPSTTFAAPGPYSALRVETTLLVRGIPNAFFNSEASIDGAYVDGLSFTTGLPRQHLFTVAAGTRTSQAFLTACPCENGEQPPAFVGSFACNQRARTSTPEVPTLLYDDDFNVCRDGAFDDTVLTVDLPAPQSTPIELRVMADGPSNEEAVVFRTLEVWTR